MWRASAKVCLLGSTVGEELFGRLGSRGLADPDQEVPFQVIGVLFEQGQHFLGPGSGRHHRRSITTVQQKLMNSRLRIDRFSSRLWRDRVEQAIDEITSLLRQRHRLAMSEPDDFMVRSPGRNRLRRGQQVQVMRLLLRAWRSLSLLVGGIGIMNIMLVSVTERTREIGVRRALGARAPTFSNQFLAESALVRPDRRAVESGWGSPCPGWCPGSRSGRRCSCR